MRPEGAQSRHLGVRNLRREGGAVPIGFRPQWGSCPCSLTRGSRNQECLRHWLWIGDRNVTDHPNLFPYRTARGVWKQIRMIRDIAISDPEPVSQAFLVS